MKIYNIKSLYLLQKKKKSGGVLFAVVGFFSPDDGDIHVRMVAPQSRVGMIAEYV